MIEDYLFEKSFPYYLDNTKNNRQIQALYFFRVLICITDICRPTQIFDN